MFCGLVSTSALAEAKSCNLPVLSLPEETRIRDVEKTIVGLLVNRKGNIERRGTQIYRQLTQISSRNEGMDELSAMARLTKKTVILQDKRLRPISHKLQPSIIGVWDDVEFFLKKQDNLPVELHDRHRVIEVDPPVLMQALPVSGVARLVAPVITKNIGRGCLSISAWKSDLDEATNSMRATARRLARWKWRNRKPSRTEKRLRGTFSGRLLLGMSACRRRCDRRALQAD